MTNTTFPSLSFGPQCKPGVSSLDRIVDLGKTHLLVWRCHHRIIDDNNVVLCGLCHLLFRKLLHVVHWGWRTRRLERFLLFDLRGGSSSIATRSSPFCISLWILLRLTLGILSLRLICCLWIRKRMLSRPTNFSFLWRFRTFYPRLLGGSTFFSCLLPFLLLSSRRYAVFGRSTRPLSLYLGLCIR